MIVNVIKNYTVTLQKKSIRIIDGGLTDFDETGQSTSPTRLPELPQKKNDRTAALANGLPTRIDLRGSLAKTNCEVGIGNALVAANRDETTSNARTEILSPQCGRNTQTDKENVVSSAGTATGQPNALSSGMSGALGSDVWEIAKRIFDPGGLSIATQTSHELAVIEQLCCSFTASLSNDTKKSNFPKIFVNLVKLRKSKKIGLPERQPEAYHKKIDW